MAKSLDDDEEVKDMITLVGTNGQVDVGRSAMRSSIYINTTIEHDQRTKHIYIHNDEVGSLEILGKWLNHFDGNDPAYPPKPLPFRQLEKWCKDEWIQEFFMSLDQNELFNLIKLANFVNAPVLIEYCSAAIASLTKGKTVDEIKVAVEAGTLCHKKG